MDVVLLIIIGIILFFGWANMFRVQEYLKKRKEKKKSVQSGFYCIKRDIEIELKKLSDGKINFREKESFESLPKHLKAAEDYLDQAVSNFSNNTPTPFWDSIENVYTELYGFMSNIESISSAVISYDEKLPNFQNKISRDCQNLKDLLNKYENWLQDYKYVKKDIEKYLEKSKYLYPKFSVKKGDIRSFYTKSHAISQRAEKIAKEAQKKFDFAHIYEIRKNNEVLMFRNIGTLLGAINHTTQYLTSAIDRCESELERHEEKRKN